jgi:hypothetical protein
LAGSVLQYCRANPQSKKLPPGRPVEVFFNPANPAETVLERRVSGGGHIYLTGLLIIVGAATVAGLF